MSPPGSVVSFEVLSKSPSRSLDDSTANHLRSFNGTFYSALVSPSCILAVAMNDSTKPKKSKLNRSYIVSSMIRVSVMRYAML